MSSKLGWSRRELREAVAALGVVAGDVIMIHAALRRVGPMLNGPDALIGAVLDVLGSSGMRRQCSYPREMSWRLRWSGWRSDSSHFPAFAAITGCIPCRVNLGAHRVSAQPACRDGSVGIACVDSRTSAERVGDGRGG